MVHRRIIGCLLIVLAIVVSPALLPRLHPPTIERDQFLYDYLFQGPLAYRYSVIKSAQSGVITASTSSTTVTTGGAISTVTTANSALCLTGWDSAAGTPIDDFWYLTFTSTQVTGNRTGTGTVTPRLPFTVTEFYGNVLNSRQDIDISLSAGQTTNTQTITAVNPAKVLIAWRGTESSETTTGAFYLGLCGLEVTNSTTITAKRGSAGTAASCHGTVLEFK